jgi:hypothetical protein
MTELPAKRPAIASLISIFEICVFVIALLNYFWLQHRLVGHPISPHVEGTILSNIRWASYLLAPLAAATLWKMRRLAFYLLALRFGLGIVWFIISRIHAVPPSHAAVRWGVYFLSIVSLSVSGTIAWYAYNITLPKVMKSQNSREV